MTGRGADVMSIKNLPLVLKADYYPGPIFTKPNKLILN